jgi:hypothetical protein
MSKAPGGRLYNWVEVELRDERIDQMELEEGREDRRERISPKEN